MARPRSSSTTNVGVYIGKVTRVDGRACYVELPALSPGLEYGPARYPAALADHATDPAGTGPHTHDLTALVAANTLSKGDAVAVAFLEGRRDDVVVLARLA